MQIVLKYSTDFGTTWSAVKNLGASLSPGSHAQGVMFKPDQMVKFMLLLLFMMLGQVVKMQLVLQNQLMEELPGLNQEFMVHLPNGSFNFGIRGNLKPTSNKSFIFPFYGC